MRKKAILMLLVICVLLVLSGCSIKDKNTNLEYKQVGDNLTVSSYNDSVTKRELIIPDEYDSKKITSIGKFGIANSENLLVIRIGKNVTNIEDWGIVNNQNLYKIYVDDENPNYTDVDGVLYTKDLKTLVCYPNRNAEKFDKSYLDTKNSIPKRELDIDSVKTTYKIIDECENVANRAFYKVDSLGKVFLGKNVQKIGDMSFFKCVNLKEIIFNEGLIEIGVDGVSFCSGLKSIILPSTIEKINDFAFFDCYNIRSFSVLNKKENVTLGDRWMPSNNGKELTWQENDKTVKLEIKWGV